MSENGRITLSDREYAVLKAVSNGGTPTGIFIAGTVASTGLDISPAGAHRTASSLVRKKLAQRLGTARLQWYGITPLGQEVLRRERVRRIKAL